MFCAFLKARTLENTDILVGKRYVFQIHNFRKYEKVTKNRPKTLPKSVQNGCPIKHAIFHQLFSHFDHFLRCAQRHFSKCLKPIKNSGFVALQAFRQCATAGARTIEKCPKNIPKTVPKRGPRPFKIDAENDLFFNIDFFAS